MVNFKNTLIIMTSNIGSHDLSRALAGIIQENFENLPAGRQAWSARMWTPWWRKCARGDGSRFAGTVRPEFLNRVDELIMFRPLSQGDPAVRDRSCVSS